MSNKFAYARDGQVALLNMVIKSEPNFDVNAKDEDERTLLHWAASGGHSEIVDLLLNTYHADPNSVDDEGWTPLLSACATGRLSIVKSLLKSGAHLNTTSSQGVSCLAYAASKAHEDVVDFLLQQKISVSRPDKHGNTPLHRAVRNISIVRKLLKAGANVDSINASGQSPLHIAAQENEREVCIELLAAGADPSVKDKDGYTPITYGGQALEDVFTKKR